MMITQLQSLHDYLNIGMYYYNDCHMVAAISIGKPNRYRMSTVVKGTSNNICEHSENISQFSRMLHLQYVQFD